MYVCPRGSCTLYKKPLLLDVCPGRGKSNICGMSEEGYFQFPPYKGYRSFLEQAI